MGVDGLVLGELELAQHTTTYTLVYFHIQNELCVASGPGVDMKDSTRIIGERQFEAAKVHMEPLVTLDVHLFKLLAAQKI